MSGKDHSALASIAKGVPKKAAPVETRVKPTPEQIGKFRRDSSKVENGQVTSVAYHREPIFETLAKGNTGITAEGLAALRFWRNRHEETAISLTRCALDVESRGGRGIPTCLPMGMGSDMILDRIEAAIGNLIDTMRAVVLEDQSFSDVAIARWGSRKQSWIVQEAKRPKRKGGKAAFVEKIVPKSGRHRELIRDEFLIGLKRLVLAVRLMTSNVVEAVAKAKTVIVVDDAGGAEVLAEATAASAPPIDAAFLNEEGYLRPWSEIAEIIRDRNAAE